jgi:hypothetical protein
MFTKTEDEDMTLFQKCMKVWLDFILTCNFNLLNLFKILKAIQNMYQHKIYGSDKDFLGIVFFGTEKVIDIIWALFKKCILIHCLYIYMEKNNTGEDFLHMFMLQVSLL